MDSLKKMLTYFLLKIYSKNVCEPKSIKKRKKNSVMLIKFVRYFTLLKRSL